MALTFPRTLPARFKVKSFTMKIVRQTFVAQTRGGLVQGTERGRPLWQATGEMSIASAAHYDELLAYFDSLRGPINPFRLYNIGRRRPILYPGIGWAGFTRHGGGAFDGTATVSSASGYSVTIGSLPSNFVLSDGDMISWTWRSSRTLHRIVQGATANNGVATVQVEPDVPAGGTLPQTVMLEAADAMFRLTEQEPGQYVRNYGDGIGFTAIQALY